MKLSTRVARAGDLLTKAGHAALREIAQAPEQRAARVLAADVARRSPPPSGKRVTFLTPRSWASHVQWEAVIADALKLRGAAVSFVTCGGGLGICDRSNTWESPPPPCRTCSKYVVDTLGAHGLPPSLLSDRWDDTAPEWPEIDHLGLRELAAVEHAGLPLGRLVEIPVKWFLLRSDMDEDPLAALTYRRFLRSARLIADALVAEVDRLDPEVIVLCNGLFLFEAIAIEICRRRDIDIVTYERGLIQETLLFGFNTIACMMDMTPHWVDWQHRALTAAENGELDDYLDARRYGRRSIDRYWDDVVFSSGDEPAVRLQVTLLPNLTWDSAVIGQSAAYDGLDLWIRDTIDLVAERDDVDLTIRVHPAETKLPGKQTREPVREVIDRRFPTLPANVRVIDSDDPTSSYSLLEQTDVVLVFSSTTGLEASMMGKPVIVAGQTHYRGKGFTIDAVDPDDYQAQLSKLLDHPASFRPDVERARRYAYLLFFRAPVEAPGAIEHILGLAKLTTTSASSIAPGADASLDRICDGILNGTDFGPEPPR